MNSKEAEEHAMTHDDFNHIRTNFSQDEIEKYTKNLTGLAACDVEKGTEPFWLNEGKTQLNNLHQLSSKIESLSVDYDVDDDIIIGTIRVLQKEYVGKTNLSLARYKVVKRLLRRVNLN